MMAHTSETRIHAKEEQLVPKVMVGAVVALLLSILALVTIAKITDRPLESKPNEGTILSERAIFIDSDATGAARVFDSFGVLLADFSAEKGGFVAGVDRVIIRERSRSGAKMSSPVMLRLREGNRLSIYDPETKWSAELMGFGTTNLRTFARLLKQP